MMWTRTSIPRSSPPRRAGGGGRGRPRSTARAADRRPPGALGPARPRSSPSSRCGWGRRGIRRPTTPGVPRARSFCGRSTSGRSLIPIVAPCPQIVGPLRPAHSPRNNSAETDLTVRRPRLAPLSPAADRGVLEAQGLGDLLEGVSAASTTQDVPQPVVPAVEARGVGPVEDLHPLGLVERVCTGR